MEIGPFPRTVKKKKKKNAKRVGRDEIDFQCLFSFKAAPTKEGPINQLVGSVNRFTGLIWFFSCCFFGNVTLQALSQSSF